MAALDPDLVLLVADAGLGTINSIRLSVDALAGARGATPEVPVAVVLNRYDGNHEIHRRNRSWLESRDGYLVVRCRVAKQCWPTWSSGTDRGPSMTLALVMGGGGIAGIAWHTGILLGLSESGADPSGADLLIGTSAGATVAAQIGLRTACSASSSPARSIRPHCPPSGHRRWASPNWSTG